MVSQCLYSLLLPYLELRSIDAVGRKLIRVDCSRVSLPGLIHSLLLRPIELLETLSGRSGPGFIILDGVNVSLDLKVPRIHPVLHLAWLGRRLLVDGARLRATHSRASSTRVGRLHLVFQVISHLEHTLEAFIQLFDEVLGLLDLSQVVVILVKERLE